jgi:putative transposase
MDDQILSLYAKGISTRDIVADFPDAKVQLCIVHMLRSAMKFVPWKNYKAVTADLKLIYKSTTEQKASLELDRFADKWDDKYPQISKSWRIAPHVRN